MLRKQGLMLRLLVAACVVCGGLVVGLHVPVATAQATLVTVAQNLDNPRGLAFAADGSLYVAEAGKGGTGACVPNPEGGERCYGASGAITRIANGAQQRIVSGLPSLAPTGGGGATGPHDVSLLSNGDAYVVVGLGARPDGVRASIVPTGTQFGTLMRVDLGGAATQVADIAAFEKANDPDTLGVDSNPYAVVAFGDRRLVADAGANSLFEVAPDGATTTLATIPNRAVAGSPPGGMQPVPNSLAVGPDGALYLGELTGFPFPVGGARIYRIVPGQPPQIFAQGLTAIIDMAFAADGSLYVLEIAANGLGAAFGSGNFQGALIKIAPNGTQTTVLDQGLTAPAGIAISPAGGIYLSNFGIAAGAGQVVRVTLCAVGDTNCAEPRPLATPLATTLTGAAEVDTTGAPNKGDPDGRGTAIITLNSAASQICVQAGMSGIAQPTFAHIHKAPAGTNGDVVINFTGVISGTNLSGCVAATPEQIAEIDGNPASFYLNVHNGDFPAGALRGQLADADKVALSFTVVAQGLDNPRGLDFGPNGGLYVAEAGKGGSGPCIIGPEGNACYGASGAITRIISSTQERIVTGLPSLAAANGSNATGPHDLAVQADGTIYTVVGLGGNTNVRATFSPTTTEFGQLLRISPNGQRRAMADLAQYEQTTDPDKAESGPDSNPYALVGLPNRQFVVDAGGNDLLEVDERGGITTVVTFGTRLVPAPPIPNLPPQIPMQAVPNAVAIGPDGAFYVGQLTGFPFPVGGARVYRVVPGQQPEIYADGFTNIIDIAFGEDGSLYVLEIVSKGLLQAQGPGGDPTGAVIRVAPSGARATIANDGLITPTGIAIGADGIYISNFGTAAGGGQIVRLDLCAGQGPTCEQPKPMDEPLAASLSGAAEVDNTGAPNKGDLDGGGSVLITIDVDAGRACVQGSVSNIAQTTATHIHRGAAGTNGPVVVDFTSTISGTRLLGCVSADKAVLAEIAANPAGFYYNVHNADFRAGAIRGQLARANAADTRTYLTFLPIVYHQ